MVAWHVRNSDSHLALGWWQCHAAAAGRRMSICSRSPGFVESDAATHAEHAYCERELCFAWFGSHSWISMSVRSNKRIISCVEFFFCREENHILCWIQQPGNITCIMLLVILPAMDDDIIHQRTCIYRHDPGASCHTTTTRSWWLPILPNNGNVLNAACLVRIL
jgi:hypothetical protein